MTEPGLDEAVIDRLKSFLGLSAEDQHYLRQLRDRVSATLPQLVNDFYRKLETVSEFGMLLSPPRNGCLTQIQQSYFESLTTGPYDTDYVKGRLQVGEVHQETGLTPTWYLGAYRAYLGGILSTLAAEPGITVTALQQEFNSLLKVVFFDLGLAMEAYLYAELRQIRTAKSRLRTIMDSVDEGIITINEKGDVITFNRAASDLFGYEPEEIIGHNISCLMPESFASQHDGYLQAYLKTGRSACLSRGTRELEAMHKDGRPLLIELQVRKCRHEGEIVYLGIVRDLGTRRQTELRLLQQASVVEQTADSVIITSPEGVIEYVNPAFEKVTGYSRAEVTGKTPRLIKSGMHDRTFFTRLWQTIKAGDVFRDTVINRRRSGELYYEDKTITPLLDARQRIVGFVSTGRDITDRIQSKQRLNFLANNDPLTELANRSFFSKRLEQAAARASRLQYRLAVLYLDMDRFKAINKFLEAELADELLKQIAARLRAVIRQDDMVARLGGDEFGILLEGVRQHHDVQQVVDKVREQLHFPFLIGAEEIFITASIGICLYPADSVESGNVLQYAETAMHQVKQRGGDDYHFYLRDTDNHAVIGRVSLEAQLYRALEQREFELYYQPQVDLRTRRVIGVEALLRWRHPERGLVSPAEFIPALEDTGLIAPVGEWVLTMACEQNQRWQAQGIMPLSMAVNISPRQFMRSDLASVVMDTLAATGHAAEHLHLEITENLLIHNDQALQQVMKTLNLINIQFSIDDFGTGYSSLAYLKHFPFSIVKLDRSFVKDICDKPEDAAIATAIIQLAHSLNIKVIAEGVETSEQLDFLSAQECDFMQGFLFSRPLSAEDVTVLLRSGKQLSR